MKEILINTKTKSRTKTILLRLELMMSTINRTIILICVKMDFRCQLG